MKLKKRQLGKRARTMRGRADKYQRGYREARAGPPGEVRERGQKEQKSGKEGS